MRWLFLVGLLGCSEPVSAPVAPEGVKTEASAAAPDLVLLLVTGLRAGDGAEDAFWEGMGRQPDLRFANAYAQASAPFTSLGSVLTGRYVGAIPMCGRLLKGDRAAADDQQVWCANIPDDRNTLAEVLGLYGYRSAIVTAGVPGADELTRGFQEHQTADNWADAATTASAWWAADDARPRLLLVVLGDGGDHILGQAELPRFPERKLQWLEPVSAAASKIVVDPEVAFSAYRAGAKMAGQHLGTVLSVVTAEGPRPTWSFAGSTSGMSLTERTGFEGSPVPLLTDNLLLERTVHVPLGVFRPARSATTEQVDAIVEMVDLFPTMAALAGAVPPAGLPGGDLRAPEGGDAFAYAEFGDMLFLREGPYAFTFRCTLHNATSLDPGITSRLMDDQAAAAPELYRLNDVTSDPLQALDIRAQQAAVFRSMRKRLIALRTGSAAIPSGAVSPERLWALRMAPSDGYW